MTHYSQVNAAVFEQIKHGHKIIEPRLNDEAHRRIKLGDLIVVVNRSNQEEVIAKVVGVLRYKTFAQLLAAFPASYFGALEVVQKELRQWYSPSDEQQYGVLGIKLHVLRKG